MSEKSNEPNDEKTKKNGDFVDDDFQKAILKKVGEPSFLKSSEEDGSTFLDKHSPMVNQAPLPYKRKPLPKDEEPTGNVWKDTEIFFKQLERSFKGRYDFWGSSYNQIRLTLQKISDYNEQNAQKLIKVLEEMEKKLKAGLKDFVKKRNEIERFSDIDYKLMTKNFKNLLELLSLQVREAKLQQNINELYEIYKK